MKSMGKHRGADLLWRGAIHLSASDKIDYTVVDDAIAQSPVYVAQHEHKIAEARRALQQESSKMRQFDRNFTLYELYKSFVSDSAIFFLNRCIALADQMGRKSDAVRCRSLMAIRCANTGMYDEALILLDSVRTEGIDSLAMGTYYEAYNNVYNELSYYSHIASMRQHYLDRAKHYEALMYQYLPATHESCFLRRELKAQGEGDLKGGWGLCG